MAKIYLKKANVSSVSCDCCYYYEHDMYCGGKCIDNGMIYIYIQVPAPKEAEDKTTTLVKKEYNCGYFCKKCDV